MTIFLPAIFTAGLLGCSREQLLQSKADDGDIAAIMELAEANESITGAGIVRKPCMPKAIELYKRAAGKGHAPAMYSLAKIGNLSNEESVMWLKKGADLGSKACMVEMRNAYSEGRFGLPRDTVLAEAWQKRVRNASEDELRNQGYEIAK